LLLQVAQTLQPRYVRSLIRHFSASQAANNRQMIGEVLVKLVVASTPSLPVAFSPALQTFSNFRAFLTSRRIPDDSRPDPSLRRQPCATLDACVSISCSSVAWSSIILCGVIG